MLEVIIIGLLAYIAFLLYEQNRFADVDRFLEKEVPNLFHKGPKELRAFYVVEWKSGTFTRIMSNIRDQIEAADNKAISNAFRFFDLESRENG